MDFGFSSPMIMTSLLNANPLSSPRLITSLPQLGLSTSFHISISFPFADIGSSSIGFKSASLPITVFCTDLPLASLLPTPPSLITVKPGQGCESILVEPAKALLPSVAIAFRRLIVFSYGLYIIICSVY